jgi:CspA family cold shock protein
MPVIEADAFYDGSGSPGPLGGKPFGLILEIDVLVSICALERAGLASLDQGQRLSFEVVRDERVGRSCAENPDASELQDRH